MLYIYEVTDVAKAVNLGDLSVMRLTGNVDVDSSWIFIPFCSLDLQKGGTCHCAKFKIDLCVWVRYLEDNQLTLVS